jgi:hypothetical protein
MHIEMSFGHVTEPELATWLKVSIEALWVLTTYLSPGTAP